METAHFQITASQVGGRVHVGGEDVTDRILAADVRVGAHEPTIVSLHLLAGDDGSSIEGRGIVHVHADVARAQAIVEFLSGVDPVELEQASLWMEGEGSLTAKMLRLLIDRAEAPT